MATQRKGFCCLNGNPLQFALSSKYSLALYELCEKRVNMGRRWSEDFTVERLRQLLGVDPDKLTAFKSLNQRAIQPAVAEVNFLSDFGCSVEPVMSGRKVVKVRLSWWKKNIDEIKATYRELQTAKGRPPRPAQRHSRHDHPG